MKSRQPSIRQLEYFITVARASNFRKAAEKLQISQPTLTTQIAALEGVLGAQLFERSRAGTLLSATGRELLPLARIVLDQYQSLLDQAASNSRDLNGTYKIGVSPTVGPYMLPKVLPELHRRYRNLRLHVREDSPRQLETGLGEGSHDLILTVLPMDTMDNKVRPLFIEPVDMVMSVEHPLAALERIEGRDLQNQEVLIMDEQHLHRQTADLCDQYGARLLRDYEGTSLDTLRQMAVMGVGIAFLPSLYVRSCIEETDHLKVIRNCNFMTRTHVAAWRKNSPSRHLFQKISYEIKSIAMDYFGDILEEVKTEDNV